MREILNRTSCTTSAAFAEYNKSLNNPTEVPRLTYYTWGLIKIMGPFWPPRL